MVTSGGTWVKARGLKDRNSFTQRVVQQATFVSLQCLLNADAVLPKDASTFMKLLLLLSTKLLFSHRAVKLQGWTLALSDDHRLRKLDSRVPKKIFGPKSDVVTGNWRRLPNGKGKVHPRTGHEGPEGE